MELDAVDKELITQIQKEFPEDLRPFHKLGEMVGVSETEAISRIGNYKKISLVRQISAIFDTNALGYKSCLVAMKIPKANLEEAVKIINEHPGVSHNYERDHDFNVWFTIAVDPNSRLGLDRTVDILNTKTRSTGTRLLPSLRVFKIGVKFDLIDNSNDLTEDFQKKDVKDVQSKLSAIQIQLIKELQEDLPVISTPFGDILARLGLSDSQFFAMLKDLKEKGILRRLCAVVKHQNLGFKANAMGVWNVSSEKIEQVGGKMAQFKAVSHCYQRPTYEDWPYSLFTMVHAKDKDECENILKEISKATGIKEYKSLYSLREFKKKRIKYFNPEFEAWEKENI